MRLTVRDGIATLLLVAIAIPYIGYLINGSMPFIQDPTGMAATGLILGAVAALVGGWIALREGMVIELTTILVGAAAVTLGILALVSENFFDPVVREVVLGGFMAAITVLWGFALLRHAGVVPAELPEAGAGARRRLGHI